MKQNGIVSNVPLIYFHSLQGTVFSFFNNDTSKMPPFEWNETFLLDYKISKENTVNAMHGGVKNQWTVQVLSSFFI